MANFSEHCNDFFFSQFEISQNLKSSIVIPVKDEEKYILKTLSQFSVQVDTYGRPMDGSQFEILVLANNCSDNSVAHIRNFQQNHPHLTVHLEEITLPPGKANIGYVRRKLMEAAYARLSKNGGGIIMTTDSDTMVARDWISQTHQEINDGADAVGGRILLYTDELEGMDEFTRLHHLKDEKYQLLTAELEGKIMNMDFDPVPRHHQHFNGSFAVTTECYAKSGGVPVVDYLEDCAFFMSLQGIDAKVRHSYKVKVYTSARCVGRTEIGLSQQLNVWKSLGNQMQDHFVESCASITARLTRKKSLMDLWNLKGQDKFTFMLNLKKNFPEIKAAEEIYFTCNNSLYFGEWYEKLITLKYINCETRYDIHIDKAINDLEMKLNEYAGYDFSHTSIL